MILKLIFSFIFLLNLSGCNSGGGNDELKSGELGLRLAIVQGNNQEVEPSQAPPIQPIVKLSSSTGVPVNGVTLIVSSSNGEKNSATVLSEEVTTDANGYAMLSVMAPAYFRQEFPVIVKVKDSNAAVEFDFTTPSNDGNTRFKLETDIGDTVTAGEPFSFVVSLVNEDDSIYEFNGVIQLQWQYTTTDSWGGISPNLPSAVNYACTFVNGVCTTPKTFYFTDATQTQYVSVGDGESNFYDAYVIEFTVNANSASTFLFADSSGGPANSANIIDISSPLSFSADDSSTDFYAALTDQFGNWISDTTQVSWTASTADLTADIVDNSGVTSGITLTPTTTTSATLTIADTSGSGHASVVANIEITPGIPAGLTHNTENSFTENVNTYFDNDIELVDQHGNICTQVSDLIQLDVLTASAINSDWGPFTTNYGGLAAIRTSGLVTTNTWDGISSQTVYAFFINGVSQAGALETLFRDARYSPALTISTPKKIFNASSGSINIGAVPDLSVTSSPISLAQPNVPVGYFITKDGVEAGCYVSRDNSYNCDSDIYRDLTLTTDDTPESFHIFYYDSSYNLIYNNPSYGLNCSAADAISTPQTCAQLSSVSFAFRGAFLGGGSPADLSDNATSNPAPKVKIDPLGGSIGTGYIDITDTYFPTEISTMVGVIDPGSFVALEIEAVDGSNSANTVDATGTYSLTIKAIDGLGNHVTTLSGINNFSFTGFSGASNSPLGTAPVYASNGNYNFVNGTVTITGLKLPLAGDSLTGITATTGSVTSNSITINSVAGAISTIKIRDTIGDAGNDLTGQALSYTTDDTVDYYTSGYDSEENFVSTLSDAAFSGTATTLATTIDFGATARLYYNLVGSGVLTATYNSISASTGTITVDVGAASYYDIQVAEASPWNVGDALTMQISLVDADGNIITTDNSSKTISFDYRDSSNSILSPTRYVGPSSVTENLSSGSLSDQTVTYYEAGPSIKLNVDDGTYSGSWSGSIVAGAFDRLLVTSDASSLTAGSSQTQTVVAADQYDNTLTTVNTDLTINLTSALTNQDIEGTNYMTSVSPGSLASGAPYDSTVTGNMVNGFAQFDVSAQEIGTLAINVSTSTAGITDGTNNITIIPDAIDGIRWASGFEPLSQYEATASNWSTIIAELYDQYGNVVNSNSGQNVVLTLEGSPTGSLSGTTTRQTNFGQAFFNDINYVKVETVTLRATHTNSGEYIESSIDIIPSNPKRVLLVMQGETFVEGVTNISSAITGTPDTYSVDDTVSYTVDAYVVDEAFNKVENYGGNITLEPEDPNAVVTPSGATSFDSTGQASFTISFRKSGSQKINLNCNGFFTSSFCHSSTSFTVNPGVAYQILPILPGESFATTGVSSKASAVSGTPTSQTAGTSFNIDFYMVDKYFNLVDDDTSSITTVMNNDSNASTDSGIFTDGHIQLSPTNILADNTLSVTASDVAGVSELTSTTYTVDPASATQYIALLPGETLTSGVSSFASAKGGSVSSINACSAFDLDIYAVDPYFNIDTTYSGSVSLITSDTDDDEASYSGSFAAGEKTFSVTPVVLGNNNNFTITSVLSNAGTNSQYDTSLGSSRKLIALLPGETFTPGKLNYSDAVTGSMSPDAVAGDAFTVTVKSVDSCHNVDTSSTQTVSMTTSDTNDTDPTSLALSTGSVDFSVTNTTAQAGNSISVSAASHTAGISSSYTVVPNVPTQTAVFLPGETHVPGVGSLALAKTGTPTNQTVNQNFTATVKLLDAYFNTVTSATYDGTSIGISTSDTNDTDPTASVTSSGQVSFTVNNKTADTAQNLTISSSYTDNASANYDVDPAAATQSIVILPGQLHTPGVSTLGAAITGLPTVQVAGASFLAEVKAVDAYFNTVTTYTSSVSLSTNDSNDTHPSIPNVFTAGVATFTVTNTTHGASHSITASTGLSTNNTSDTYSVDPGTASQVILFLPNDSALNEGAQSLASARSTAAFSVDTATNFTVNAYIVDDYFNVVDDDTTQVTLGFFGDSYATNDGPLITTDGLASFTVQNNTAGASKQILVSTDNGSISSNHGTGAYTVNAGSPVKIVTILPGESFVEGAVTHAAAVTGSPSLATACIDTYQVTFRAVDSSYNTVTSYSGSFDFTTSDPGDPQTGYTGVSFSSGVATVNLKPSKKDMSSGYTLSLSNTGGLTADTVSNYLVNSGAAAKIATFLDGQSNDEGNRTFTKNGSANSVTVGSSYNITAQALDACHNSVGSVTSTVTLATEDPYDTEPASQSLNIVSGAATFSTTHQTATSSFPQAGISQHKATISVTGGYTEVDSDDYNVAVGTKDEILIVLDGETFSYPGKGNTRADVITGSPNTQEVGSAYTTNIYTVDAYYNVLASDSTNISIVSSDTGDTDPSLSAMSSGSESFSLTPVDVQASASITVTDTDTATPYTSPNYVVNDVAPSSLDYANADFTWTKDTSVVSETPTHSGGVITSYTVTSGSLPTGISLNSTTGELSGTPTALYPTSTVQITATNSGGSTSTSFDITVNAIAPSALTYSNAPFSWEKNQSVVSETPSVSGGAITGYSIVSGSLPTGISLNSSTGELSGTPSAVYASNTVTIRATNSGGTDDVTITIEVLDERPSTLDYANADFTWSKDTTIVSETPTNSGGTITSYTVTSGALPSGISLNATTGELSGTPTVIYSVSSIIITGTNASGSTTDTFNITVNDIAPASIAYGSSTYTWTKDTSVVSESPSGNTGGSVTSYSLQSGSLPAGISLNSSTGELSGTPSALYTSSSVTIRAANTGGYQDISLTLVVNDIAPAALSYGSSTYTWTKDTSVVSETPSGNTGGAVVSYTLLSGSLPSGISLNSSTGELSGTPTALYTSSSVTIRAVNTGGNQDITLTLEVNDIAPTSISYSSPFTWSKDLTVVSELPSGNAGGPVTSYTLQSGSLPTGISLNASTGELSGTPTADYATASITIRAANTGGYQDISFNITVSSSAPASIAYGSASYSWTKDTSVVSETPSGNTGSDVVSYSLLSGSLPSGISLNSSTGELSGTPTALYTSASVTIRAANTGGNQDITLTLEVNDTAPTSISYSSPFTWSKDLTVVSELPSGNTGGPVTSWTLQSGSLPTGISLNASTGELSGTPSADYATASITIRAANTGGYQDISFNITVSSSAPASIAYGSASYSWTKDTSVVSETPSGNTGSDVVSYSLLSGSLPSGISLNSSTGELSGTPTALYTSASVTIRAANTGGNQDMTLTLEVNDIAPTSISYSSPFTWTKDTSVVSESPSGNAGGPVTSYTLQSGSLPTGISLNASTGELSGTPSADYATASITIRASNTGGYQDISFNITVSSSAPASIAYGSASYSWTKDTSVVSETPSGNTGSDVVSYSLLSGSLPSGISLNSSTGELSGTPTALYTSASVTIRAVNTGGNQDITLTLEVNDIAPTSISYSSPFTWTKDTSVVSESPSGNTGGPVTSWTLQSGSLPTGISLNASTGVLSGTPSALYTSASVTIRAANTGGYQDISLTMEVNDIGPTSIAYGSSSYSWTKDTTVVSENPSGNTGGSVTSYTVQSGSLPSGISLNSSTGALSGTPDAIYTSASVTIRAANTGGYQDITLTLEVNDIIPAGISYASPYTWTKDTSIVNETPSGNTGGAVISYSLQSGSLPTGISLNASTGELSGTPSVIFGTTSVTIRAANTGGYQDISFNITVNDAAPASLSYAGSPYTWSKDTSIVNETPSGNTGGTVTSYTLQSGSLPSGMSLNSSTGEISGTPTASYASASITVRASNTGGFQDINATILVNGVELSKSGDSESYGSTSTDDTSTFTITNDGTITSNTLTTTFTPDDANYWNIVIDNCDSTTIASAANCSVQVTFQGSTGNFGSPVSGSYSATLIIDDGTESASFTLTATIP